MIKLQHPIPGATPTDAFGWRPAIPGVVAAQLHTGQDYAASHGTPIYAAHAGRVNRVWWDTMLNGSPAGGNMLQIGSANVSTRYAHLSRYAVNAGQTVKAGDLIGYVGSSGAATGAHLHFEVLLPGGQFVNPLPYIFATVKPPPPTPEEEETVIYIRRSAQTRVYAYSPLTGKKRALKTVEWNAIKRAAAAAGTGVPVVNLTAAEAKHFGIK